MNTRYLSVITFLLAFSFPGAVSMAVSTHFFRQSPSAGFETGRMENTSLTAEGIKLAPGVDMIKGVEEPFVWCLTQDEYHNIYIGTGDPGSVYKLSPLGNLVLLYRSTELYVQSLAVSPTGRIFVGTSPNGIIYKITPWRDTVLVCDLPDSYVWKLKFDSKGTLYAATGPEGKIYRISEDGEATVFFDSSQANILDMVVDKEDNVYACGEPDGLIYRITPDGRAFVIYDAEEGEVHCLSMDGDGNLYAGTASGARPRMPVRPPTPPARPFLESRPSTETGPPVGISGPLPQQDIQPLPRPPRRPPAKPMQGPAFYGPPPKTTNFVYKITPAGIIRKVLKVQPGFVFALVTDDNNNTYVGTGNEARLYKIDGDENTNTVLEREESQILSLTFIPQKGLFFGTGNTGRLFKLSQAYSPSGTFVSSVLDATISSSWGRLSWDAEVPEGTGISVATRTGNSARPDNTWSEWSVKQASGETITGPLARFIQYRVSLSTGTPLVSPLLRNISIAYLPTNQPPEIISLTVGGDKQSMTGRNIMPYGRRGGPDKSTNNQRRARRGTFSRKPTAPEAAPKPGSKLIEWKASDANGDKLAFILYYRGVDEKNWKLLGEETEKTSYLWQTTRVPDGEYRVKLVATDRPDNPPDVALSTEKASRPVMIDNTRPRLTNLSFSGLEHRRVSVKGDAHDELSGISRIQYSVDAGNWIDIFPADKIFDSSNEPFSFVIDGLPPGEHTVVVNATDIEGNVGSCKVVIDLSPK